MNIYPLIVIAAFLTTSACQNKVKLKTVTSESSKDKVSYKPGSVVEVKEAEDGASYPLIMADASAICSHVTFYNAAGELSQGTADCSGLSSDSNLKPEYIKEGVTIGGVTGTVPAVTEVPEFSPENIRAGVTIAGITGTLVPSPANCAADGEISCVSTAGFPAAAASGLAAKIASGQTVAGVNGTFSGGSYSSCSADGELGCVTTASYRAALTTGLAAKVISGNTVAGIGGSATAESHNNCTSDGQAGCVVVGPAYAAAVTAGAAGKILSGQSVAGINGNVTLPAVGKVLTGTSFGVSGTGSSGTLTLPLASTVLSGSGTYGDPGAALTPSYSPDFPDAANVRSGDTVNGANGTLADCSAAGQSGCVATATYKTMDLSAASATTDLTAGNFNTTISTAANFEFWDSTGARHQLSGDADLAAANIVSGAVIHGVTGSATVESHSNCTAANQSGCIATATYKTMNLTGSGTDTGLTAGNFNTTIATSGNFEFWDITGVRHSVAGDTDLVAGNVLTGKNIFGVNGSVTATPANCSSNGSQSCVATGSYYAATSCAADGSNCYVPSYVATTQPLKAISYDAINAGKASIRTSLTLSGIAGTLADCGSNGTTGCVTTATYKSADLTNLAAGNIKRGISIAGTTGNFPSATSPLPNYSDSGATTNTAGSDITDLTNFITQLTTDGSFEFWDSSGIRRTGSGDSDIVAGNIKNAVALENFSLTGSYTGAASNCTADGQTGCTTTSTYKSVDTSALTVWDIRKGKSAGGIAGSLTFFKNMANTTLFNRTAGTGAAAGLDYYDTIDDYNNNGAFPTQNNTGWDQATGANWTAVEASTTYRDEITGLVWLKDDASTYTWENAITKCENSTAGSRSDWRLPTQKELMQAYTDGIWSQKTGLSLTTSGYWSASTVSNNTTLAWGVALYDGYTYRNTKTNTGNVVCVAP